MSLRTDKINLDDLPSENFLRNPLGTKAAAPPPLRIHGAAQLRNARIGGFHVTKQQQQQEEDDDDDDDDDDEPDNNGIAALAQKISANDMLEQRAATGPFSVLGDTNKAKLTFIAGFRDCSGSLSRNAASVNLRFSDILKASDNAQIAQKLSSFDPTRTVPISLSILGTSLGDLERHCSIEVYDAAGKSLFSKYVQKHNSSDTAHTSGYPLFLLKPGGSNQILFNPPALTADHRSYWAFDMSSLEKNTSNYVNPNSGDSFKIVKRNSKAAALLDYALSVKNRFVTPRLLENPSYVSSDDPELLRVPLDLYNKTCNAYRKKLGEINASSFDLSTIKVVLKPLALSTEMKMVDPSNISGNVAIQLVAHIPTKADFEDDGRDVSEYIHKVDDDDEDSDDSDDDF